ncbi:Ig-like domain-containing protein [Paenibacillus sp. NPDC093718]|uniref:Ig-like domain-containing protein n=1 Tax=Paenibacillus sp. NPDC093718 TaxID=3390601 RepID=UPI003D041423
MKRKPIINRRFKYLMAVFIILFGQLLPMYPQQAEAAADNWLNFKFDEFSQNTFTQSFAKNGSAEVPQGQNFIRLTPPTTVQSGAVFTNTALCPRDNYSFSTAFSFRMSNASSTGPSDGLTFTLQTGTTSQHRDGGGLGYYGISPSFAVKYDTFLNTVYNDPSANSVGLALNGDVVNKPGWYTELNQYNSVNNTNYVLSNGTQYYTWIDYNSSVQKVQVYLGTSPDRVNASKVLEVDDIDLSSIFGGKSIHAGFTGSTGAPNYETHDIHSWYFVNAYAPIETLNPNNTYKVNEPPTVPGNSKITAVNTPVSGQVNGTDPDGDPLTYAKGATAPKNGTVTVNADGNWTYTPAQDFIGTDSFTVIANDGKCATAEATIDVEVLDLVPPTTPQPPNVCGPRVALINGSFEQPEARNVGDKGSPGAEHAWMYFYEHEVPGWQTTATDDFIQIMQNSNEFLGPNLGGNGQTIPVVAADGKQFAELNANQPAMLYQDVKTNPGQTIYWRLAHRGEFGVDTMQLRIGSPDISPDVMPIIQRMDSTNNKWTYYTGTYTVPDGQTVTRFGFEAVQSSNGNLMWGNLIDDIFLGTEPCGVATKSVSPIDNVQEGDTLTYSVNFKNEGGDETGNTVFTDNIPDGTEYVPGSLEIVSGPNTGTLTDVSGDDPGEFLASENQVVVRLGNGANGSQAGRIPNTAVLPEGTTVQFKVKVLSKYKTTEVANQAIVEYDNLLSGNHETRKSNDVKVNVNRPPITPDYEETTWKNTTVTGSVYGVDANGDSLTFTKGTDPGNGTVTVNPDGTWTYTPDPDFVGEDTFTVIVSDGKGGTSTSTVKVNVNEPPNQPPVTENYDVTTEKDASVTGSVYGTDPDGDTLTYAIESNPKHGSVIVNPDGTWEYVPDPGYVGPDIFTVTVSDGKGGVTTSTVTVNVTDKPNKPPIASDENVTTEKDTSVTGDVYGTDPDGDPLTYIPGKQPGNGTVIVKPDGSWIYTPDPGFVGEDRFTVIVDDGKGGKTEVEIIVDVTDTTTPPSTNQPPVSPDKNVTTEKDTSVTGDVYGTDPDGDPLTYTPGKQPGNGTVIVKPDGSWTYTPDPGFVGEDSFTVIVDDGKGGTIEVTVIVDVTEPNTPPTDPGNGTDPTDPGSGTNPTDPGTGTNPTNPGTGTNPTDPGSGTNPTDPGTGTNPTDPGTGTNPTDPGSSANPTDPGTGTTPADSGDGTGQSDSAKDNNEMTAGESAEVPSPADQSGEPQGNKLPNTSTNVYNLGLLGMIVLLSGWLLLRKRKLS